MTTPPATSAASDGNGPDNIAVLRARLAELEASLRAQTGDRQQRLELLLEQVPCVMWTMGADFTITAAWGAGLALMGRTPEYMAGRSRYQFFTADDPGHLVVAGH